MCFVDLEKAHHRVFLGILRRICRCVAAFRSKCTQRRSRAHKAKFVPSVCWEHTLGSSPSGLLLVSSLFCDADRQNLKFE